MFSFNRRILYISLIILSLLLVLQGCTNSNKASKESPDPKTIVEKFTTSLFNNNINEALAFVSDDIIIEQIPPGIKYQGKDNYEIALQNSSRWNHKERVTSPFTVDGNKVSFTTEQEGEDYLILGLKFIRIAHDCIVKEGKISEYRIYPDASDWQVAIKNNAGGIGIHMCPIDNGLLIDQVMKNSPAEKSGLKSGDIIIAINNLDCSKMNPEIASLRIKGPIGSKVKLTITRNNHPDPIDFDIEREDTSALAQK